jgi:hypothetical protein
VIYRLFQNLSNRPGEFVDIIFPRDRHMYEDVSRYIHHTHTHLL